jgi:integrase
LNDATDNTLQFATSTETMRGLYLRGRVWWFSYYDHEQRRRQISLKTFSESEAIQRAQIILENPTRNSGATALERFFEYRRPRISVNFHRDTSFVLLAWMRDMKARSVADITTAQLQSWFDHKCQIVKISTAAGYLTWIRVFFDWCVKNRIRFDNPAKGVDVPAFKKPYRKVFISKNAVKTLLDECEDAELKYCLFAGFHAGLRFGEVVASRPEWFDLTEGLLHVTRSETWSTKDDEDRTIPLTDDFAAFLRVYGLRVPYMIGSHKRSGKRYRFTFQKRFETYVHSKGVSITFHDCRRTFASLHASAGTSIFKVACWLGDGVQVVEKHYGFLSPSDPEINRAFN